MSGARIGKRGKSKNKTGRKAHNGQLVKQLTVAQLEDKVTSPSTRGVDRQKCQVELDRKTSYRPANAL